MHSDAEDTKHKVTNLARAALHRGLEKSFLKHRCPIPGTSAPQHLWAQHSQKDPGDTKYCTCENPITTATCSLRRATQHKPGFQISLRRPSLQHLIPGGCESTPLPNVKLKGVEALSQKTGPSLFLCGTSSQQAETSRLQSVFPHHL